MALRCVRCPCGPRSHALSDRSIKCAKAVTIKKFDGEYCSTDCDDQFDVKYVVLGEDVDGFRLLSTWLLLILFASFFYCVVQREILIFYRPGGACLYPRVDTFSANYNNLK